MAGMECILITREMLRTVMEKRESWEPTVLMMPIIAQGVLGMGCYLNGIN